MVVHSLLAIVLGSNFVVAIADNVPRYDVKAGCLGAAKQMGGEWGPKLPFSRWRRERQDA